MWTAIKGGILAIAAFFGWRKAEAEKDLRDMDREAGATKQKAENLSKAVAVKDEQLRAAAKPRRSRDELLQRAKKRTREP